MEIDVARSMVGSAKQYVAHTFYTAISAYLQVSYNSPESIIPKIVPNILFQNSYFICHYQKLF